MPDQLVNFFIDVRDTLSRLLSFLSPQQKRLIFIGLPVFGSLAYLLFFVFDRMNYGPLYSNLSPQDGAAIVKELEAEKIPYSLSSGGTVIEVPRGVLYETRLRLAGKGIPSGGGVGFEIFEKPPFGASEFTQQVNYLRALQGELSRTINSISAVQSSRIHLALPARTTFLGPEEKPSASVVVDLRPGYHLNPDQVQGIVNLVASSVPKLSADKVTVIDSSGRPLKEIVTTAAGTEAENLNLLKLRHEQELMRSIETMLDSFLGEGKAIARVNVLINPQETQMTKEQFDPENKVIRSQRQSLDEGATKGGGVPGVQANVPGGDATKTSTETGTKRSTEMVTYEVGHSTSRISEPRGQIQKISVAILVDGKYEKDKYIARSKEELNVIREVVKKAVGFNEERGDEIEVANVPFKVQPPAPVATPAAPELKDLVTSPTGLGIGAGALVGIGILAFLLLRRKKKTVAVPGTGEPAFTEVVNAEGQPVVTAAKYISESGDPRKEQLAQIARDYHDAAVRIVRIWLQDDLTKRATTTNTTAAHAEVNE
ncbi:MAG TPA: flagellar basal-body MS-ring/collar protein FliF [Candidatus Binatia bacterium]